MNEIDTIPVYSKVYKGHRIRVTYDEFPTDPQLDENMDDPSILLVSHHQKYGENHDLPTHDAVRAYAAQHCYVIYNVLLHEHSSLAYSLHAYDDRWMPGQFGYLLVKFKSIDACATHTEKLVKLATAWLQTYQAWSNGDVYQYAIYHIIDCEHCKHSHDKLVDSLCGIYGAEEALAQAKAYVDELAKETT